MVSSSLVSVVGVNDSPQIEEGTTNDVQTSVVDEIATQDNEIIPENSLSEQGVQNVISPTMDSASPNQPVLEEQVELARVVKLFLW